MIGDKGGEREFDQIAVLRYELGLDSVEDCFQTGLVRLCDNELCERLRKVECCCLVRQIEDVKNIIHLHGNFLCIQPLDRLDLLSCPALSNNNRPIIVRSLKQRLTPLAQFE